MSLQAKSKAVNDLIDLVITNFARKFNMGSMITVLPDIIKAKIDYADPMIDMVLMRAHQILHEYEKSK